MENSVKPMEEGERWKEEAPACRKQKKKLENVIVDTRIVLTPQSPLILLRLLIPSILTIKKRDEIVGKDKI